MKSMRSWIIGSSLVLMSIFILIGCQSQELTSAKLYIQQKNYERAEENLLRAEQTEPDNPEVPYLLGSDVYAPNKEWKKMNDAFERSLAIGDKYKNDIHKVRLKYWTDEFNAGAKKYNAAVDTTGDSQTALFNNAIKNFEQAVIILPDKPETYGSLATAYRMTDQIDRALRTFKQAIEKNPDNFAILVNYGTMLVQEGKTAEALNVLNKAYDLKPSNTDVIKSLANLYVKNEQPEKALEMYAAAVQEEPENPDLYFNKAMLYVQMSGEVDGEKNPDKMKELYQNAVDNLEKSLQYNPDDYVAKVRLGEIYEALENWAKAIDVFEDVLKTHPDNYQVMRKLAVAVYRQGDPQRGQELLDRAKKLEAEQQ